MWKHSRRTATCLVAIAALAVGGRASGKPQAPASTAPAPNAHAPAKAAATAPAVEAAAAATRAPLHGGLVTATKEHRFETLVTPEGLFVYVYDANGAPAMVEIATGTVTLRLPDDTKRQVSLAREVPADGEPAIYFCPMHDSVVRSAPGVCELCGGMKLYTQDRLAGRLDLSSAGATGIETSVRLRNLTTKEREVTIAQTVLPAATPAKAAPAAAPAPKAATPAPTKTAPAPEKPAPTPAPR